MLGDLNPEQIERLLQTETVGRIGLHAEGRTYVVPLTYVFEGNGVIGHTRAGMKINMARENPDVCFEVDHIDNLANWQSAVCWGRFEELHDDDAQAAMQRFMTHLQPLLAGEGVMPTHGMWGQAPSGSHPDAIAGHAAIVWRIRFSQATGLRHRGTAPLRPAWRQLARGRREHGSHLVRSDCRFPATARQIMQGRFQAHLREPTAPLPHALLGEADLCRDLLAHQSIRRHQKHPGSLDHALRACRSPHDPFQSRPLSIVQHDRNRTPHLDPPSRQGDSSTVLGICGGVH